MKNFVIYLLIATIVVFGIYKLTSRPDSGNPNTQADVVLYWGEGCPHCENVKKFIQDSQVDQKISINQLEVYKNKVNQKAMQDAAMRCNMDISQGLGVPLAVIDNKCLVGDTPIIDAIKQKIGTN